MKTDLRISTSGRKNSGDGTSEERAAIYARTSSTSQKFGYSIDEQVRQCAERCQMMGWSVAFVYKDEAVSGKDTDRPMFQEMLSKAEAGLFDILVFWKLDRFSRSIMHAVNLEKQFREWDVALYSATEQIDTTTPAGRFNFRNIANAAEFERDMIKQRTQMGHAARALEHKWPNKTAPLGYVKTENGRLSVHPKEAGLVRLIFSEYVEQRSMPSVAESLNDQQRLTKKGNDWTADAVGKILRNRIYIGEYSVGEVESTVKEYQILSQELFEKVTEIRMRFKKVTDSTRSEMDQERKEQRVEEVTAQYSDFRKSSETK
ncbi:recombinase family protein [Haloarcula sp. KBTZ06]|uniref:recombinase family protein n=1 Tax=Haloarcula sp. KBTZ06 TaxID=3402682 RepID=UPI003B439282